MIKSFNPTNTNAIRNGITAGAIYRMNRPRKGTTPEVTFVKFRSVEDRPDHWYVGVHQGSSFEDVAKAFGTHWWGYIKIYKADADRPAFAPWFERVYDERSLKMEAALSLR